MPRGGRTALIVLDGIGVGELPDAARFGDEGSNTLRNTALAVGGLDLPNLGRLGLGHILDLPGVPPDPAPIGCYGRMAEQAAGKDTTTGHWELAGVILDRPFPVYPNGFPMEVIAAFTAAIGRDVLGNKPASGTVIIDELGEEHMRTGKPIVYTSADSVFQIAAHEEVIPVEQLYEMCRIAREILQGEHAVGRVIARPFVGEPGKFQRTARRKDFSLPPPRPTILDRLVGAGVPVFSVGKIEDIFAWQGITAGQRTKSNMETVDGVISRLRSEEGPCLVFANCIDFDMLYGHRNDPEGMARALAEFDARVPEILASLKPEDLLIVVGDHGNDPTTPSTDHSREYTPLLCYSPGGRTGVSLGTRATFADVAATLAEYFAVEPPEAGTSFLKDVVG
ncbi:MAG: phosphopentomutase [Firmicutes bacterium ZCTH02-B6]|nr:MAG: phosphopentomutase [Firmicutes bacterium ZCTH02-B6]